MKFLMSLFLGLSISSAAIAGDHWDTCSNSDGTVTLSEGVLNIDGIGEIVYNGTPKVLKTIRKEKTTCVLKDTGKKATVMKNVITVEEITYNVEEPTDNAPTTEILLCSRGAGLLVPQELCKE